MRLATAIVSGLGAVANRSKPHRSLEFWIGSAIAPPGTKPVLPSVDEVTHSGLIDQAIAASETLEAFADDIGDLVSGDETITIGVEDRTTHSLDSELRNRDLSISIEIESCHRNLCELAGKTIETAFVLVGLPGDRVFAAQELAKIDSVDDAVAVEVELGVIGTPGIHELLDDRGIDVRPFLELLQEGTEIRSIDHAIAVQVVFGIGGAPGIGKALDGEFAGCRSSLGILDRVEMNPEIDAVDGAITVEIPVGIRGSPRAEKSFKISVTGRSGVLRRKEHAEIHPIDLPGAVDVELRITAAPGSHEVVDADWIGGRSRRHRFHRPLRLNGASTTGPTRRGVDGGIEHFGSTGTNLHGGSPVDSRVEPGCCNSHANGLVMPGSRLEPSSCTRGRMIRRSLDPLMRSFSHPNREKDVVGAEPASGLLRHPARPARDHGPGR